ncbi:MAG: tRNA (guanine(26)-N(2))-dimethyltransferase [Desulfurococcaceae archaeon]
MKLFDHEEIVSEGLTKLLIPRMDLYRRPDGSVEPAWMPVFYNPEAVISRDLTVLFLKAIMGKSNFFFVDLLSGTGIRGLRIAVEVGGYGILNDVDPRAYHYIRRNIALNNLEDRVEAYNNEANALLNTLVFTGIFVDYIDVDPYGSPVPFLDSIFKPIGKEAYIGVTATDVAPLACTHPRKALTRYWNYCVKVDFEKEYAVRLLIANTAMRASALEVELEPLLALAHRHFIRVFFKARRGVSKAYSTISKCTGYIWYCQNTLERGFVKTPEEARELACADGSKPITLGKTWICEIGDEGTAQRMLQAASSMQWLRPGTVNLLEVIKEEIPIKMPYFRLDRLCSLLKTNMPSINTLISELKARGISSSRTHMDPRGVKVHAKYEELVDTVLQLTKYLGYGR